MVNTWKHVVSSDVEELFNKSPEYSEGCYHAEFGNYRFKYFKGIGNLLQTTANSVGNKIKIGLIYLKVNVTHDIYLYSKCGYMRTLFVF